MKSIFDIVSKDCSKIVTKTYSTSFSMATKMLSGSIRQDIYNIYGFVRFADEIVDSFHEYPKEELLNRFEEDLFFSLENKISFIFNTLSSVDIAQVSAQKLHVLIIFLKSCILLTFFIKLNSFNSCFET